MRGRNVVKFQETRSKVSEKSHFNIKTIGSNNTFSTVILFFLSVLCSSGEAGLLSLRCMATSLLFPLHPVVGLFAPRFLLLCLSQIDLHTIPHLRCGRPRFQQHLSTILPTMQALVPTSSLRSFILLLFTTMLQDKSKITAQMGKLHGESLVKAQG